MYDVFVTFSFRNPLIYGVKLAAKMKRDEPRQKKNFQMNIDGVGLTI
jgi:hypothetical protein